MLPSRQTVRSFLAFSAIAVATSTSSPTLSAQDSPFLPPASATAAKENASGGYDLVGMTAVGKDTLLSITRQSDKHSSWVAVGKTAGEITVVSYDPRSDSAVIKTATQTLTLTMRKGAVVAGPANPLPVTLPAPAATSATAASAPALPPVVVPTQPMNQQEEKEMEARMLVTDLLEIGQQQRKAYAEAQRQAALRAADPKMPRADPAQPTKR